MSAEPLTVLRPLRAVEPAPAAATLRRAWTLLFEASGSEVLADDWYDSFAEEVLQRLPHDAETLSREAILAWLNSSP